MTQHLVLNFSNKYMFITTLILIQKWWLRSCNCSSLQRWMTSRRFLGSSNGTSPRFPKKLRNFPRLVYQMPFLKNGFTKQCFGFKYLLGSLWLYIEILYELFHWAFLLMVLHLCFHCVGKWRPRSFLIA